MQGFGEGFQRGAQYNLARQQQATGRERLKLQYADQWRQIRDQELRGELVQWAITVHAWREATGQPSFTDEQLRKRLDTLRVFDWERQYQQAWMNGSREVLCMASSSVCASSSFPFDRSDLWPLYAGPLYKGKELKMV
jgi:hypothetical protein